jgi:hypothetical protein
MTDTTTGVVMSEQMRALYPEMSDIQRVDVETHRMMALSYVWGWQDAGGATKDSLQAGDFADAYGLHAARYAADKIGYRTNIPRAWRRWSSGQHIED